MESMIRFHDTARFHGRPKWGEGDAPSGRRGSSFVPECFGGAFFAKFQNELICEIEMKSMIL